MDNNKTYRLHFTFLLFYIAEKHKMRLTATYIFKQELSSKETPGHVTLNKSSNPQIKQIKVQTMNGRVYDPLLGRFLSPDNYVQMPDFSQNFNRYAYALNNPLVYTDPSGEIIWTAITGVVDFIATAFFKGGLDPTSSRARQNAWRDFDPTAEWSKTNKAWKIDVGTFARFDGDNFGQRLWDATKRFTWELPQTVIGNVSSHYVNLGANNVKTVNYYGGATVVETHTDDWGGVTLGNIIIGDDDIIEEGISFQDNELFQHEYGHYLQSGDAGWLYYPKYGIPSLIDANKNGYWEHTKHWNEQDADRRAAQFFHSRYPDYSGWDWDGNPIYDKKGEKIKSLSMDRGSIVNPQWWEYSVLFVGGYLFGEGIISLLNF
jgi:RHS repeat-associated protein